ncbi:MAG: hypothetical protein HXS46_13615 [Theionarchaea archaeon]|nr:hypothetical protein [Theionarchaea archaeon]
MELEKRISIGAFLAAVGSIGIILYLSLGPPDLIRLWDFLISFVFGVIAGLGATLSIHGLLEKRHK